MREFGIKIPKDDLKVDILNVFANLIEDKTRSFYDQDYVFEIVKATTIEIVDTDVVIEIPQTEDLAKKIDKRVEKRLLGHILCNSCCFIPDYLGTLLSDKI